MKCAQAALRISCGLIAALAVSLSAAHMLGWVPDPEELHLARRAAISGHVSMQLSLLHPEHEPFAIKNFLSAACYAHQELAAAAVWSTNGQLIARVGDARVDLLQTPTEIVTPDTSDVLLFAGEALWGRARLIFQPIETGGIWNVLLPLTSPFVLLPGVLLFLVGRQIIVSRVENDMRPTPAAASQSTLDQGPADLQTGRSWADAGRHTPVEPLGGSAIEWDRLELPDNRDRSLSELLKRLEKSREEIHRQNEELKSLASTDSLTACLNRRSFFEQFEMLWNAAKRYDHPISCIMIDVDRFKSVNDANGHQVGDRVLHGLAEEFRAALRASDLICRYGGEEFCVLLPQIDIDGAEIAAERLRSRVEQQSFADAKLQVTISLGVSAARFGANNPLELVAQADQALYAAKRNGRNQVVRWDNRPNTQGPPPIPELAKPQDSLLLDGPEAIPFQAVASLITAMAHRDAATAAHSRRVADLCVAMSQGRMSERDCYVLETAALLHDIGKLGVPDAILFKPGPLTEEEWKIMHTHDEMGVDIICSAFDSPELQEIVATQHAWFQGHPREPHLPVGMSIHVGARILAVADAFDAMVSDRVFRKSRTSREAIDELRRCSPQQFDPEFVQRLVEVVETQQGKRHSTVPPVSKQIALKIGLQIEKLATALDEQDISTISTMAGCLGTTAAENGISQITEVAGWLEQSANNGADPFEIAQFTAELLELCRSTQSSYLEQIGETQPADGMARRPAARQSVAFEPVAD